MSALEAYIAECNAFQTGDAQERGLGRLIAAAQEIATHSEALDFLEAYHGMVQRFKGVPAKEAFGIVDSNIGGWLISNYEPAGWCDMLKAALREMRWRYER